MSDGANPSPSALPLGESVLAPGEVVAEKYRIEAVVGRGGMSVVYRATHLQLEQLVAIKVLSPAAFSLPEYVARLQREARAASRIKSEHVVRIFDIGELPGRRIPYLVMEHLTGADLAGVLAKRGTLPVSLAIECMMQVCEALAEAHAIGIIHRDLKPANLFLTESVDGSPCVKVLDFGISRCLRRHALSPLTDPGTVLGTPSYMAPEQMESTDNVSPRSDIWALGAIFYELLVGAPPFTGESLPQLFVKIMRSKTPKASRARGDVGAEIDAVIARCLALEPEDRFASVAELAWELSTLGAPAARESAARIARVADRRSAESGIDRVLPVPRLTIRPPDRPATLPLPSKKTMIAMMSAMLGGLAVGLAILGGAHVHDTDPPIEAVSAAPTLDLAPVPAPPAIEPVEPAEPPLAAPPATNVRASSATFPIAHPVRAAAPVAVDATDAGAPPGVRFEEQAPPRDDVDAGGSPVAVAPPVDVPEQVEAEEPPANND